jgi:hypothetical protein
MKEIILKFSLQTGEAKIEAKGFKGSSCQDATKFLRDTLGQVSDFQKKSEWYEQNLESTGCLNTNLCG